MSDINIVKDWMRHSQNNLTVALHSYNDLYPKQTEIACYLCQQCAETALKGYLVYKGAESPHTHDLVALCEICIKFDADFTVMREQCSTLTPYGVQVRYPNELAVDEIIAKVAIDKAQRIYDFCMAKIDITISGQGMDDDNDS